MSNFFSPEGPLAGYLENYEPRSGQQTMAAAVTGVISGDTDSVSAEGARLLVIEAETGIGKTLAYLVPAVLSGRRVVVSTATLNLQDQIMNKEVPLISRVLGREIPVVCIKGRQNYLCLYRWFQYQGSGQFREEDHTDCSMIGKWLEHTTSGDRAELESLPERSSLWPRISAQSNQCLGSDCPEATSCFVNQLRKRAGSASLLVVNHHLFFSDLALRQGGFGEVLPRYEGVIFDEAHHIENVATAFFGKGFSQYQLIDLVSDIERQAETDLDPNRYDRIVGSAKGLKQRTDEFASLFPVQTGKFHLLEFVRHYSYSRWHQEVDLLATGIKRLAKDLGDCSGFGEGWRTLEKRALELADNLLEIALTNDAGETDGYVHWYERRERSVTLSATPVKVADHLRKTLYSGVDWCIMTSATLSSGGDFSYFQQRLGLDESVEFLRLPSPFDYQRRTLIYIPEKGFPEPADPAYQHISCRRAAELLQLSRGRGLVLCTSFRGMESMAAYLEAHLEYPVFVQGNGSRNSLLQKFRANSGSVLVAVASFWEGVDVQGEALSCVIIDKLPFEVPSDPVIQARIQAVTEQGGNAFFDFQVPRAILTLRQGVGRLMRAAGDSGVIAILDVRLFTKGYGLKFRASLPPSPVVRSLHSVGDFYGTSEID
ncbi:ATP-dependent DNA helicase [Desulfopila aestuarii]|uniref:ATP-dependent DNA helicase DinG n=1 Tax=Desulfopila aestuarii DSM 18488 TaxID=1121416 RepID=A0A1M7YIS5_9BACT|nr:ATP-dependent DNA helicase [Desulfopila aestuarii]SHO52499.1 ATP-dependent DNA helicase DinG [Desulfopila aestuarii DSM 18488]